MRNHAAQLAIIKQLSSRNHTAQLAIVKQMNRQKSRSSAGNNQADEQTGITESCDYNCSYSCGIGLPNKSHGVGKSSPVTVVHSQAGRQQENNYLDLSLLPTNDVLLGHPIGQTERAARRPGILLTRSMWYILQGRTAR